MSDSVKLICASCGQANRFPIARLSAGPKCGICGAQLCDGKVAELDAATHDNATRTDGLPLLVDYWAPWCGPCRSMAPEFAEAARRLAPQVRLAKLNTELHHDVGARVGIRGLPSIVLYDRGREVARLAGLRSAADIVSFVEQHIGTPQHVQDRP